MSDSIVWTAVTLTSFTNSTKFSLRFEHVGRPISGIGIGVCDGGKCRVNRNGKKYGQKMDEKGNGACVGCSHKGGKNTMQATGTDSRTFRGEPAVPTPRLLCREAECDISH